MAKLIKIAEAKDMPPGQRAAFTVEGQRIAIFNVEGIYYAIGDGCTHRGGPLSEPAQKGVPSYNVVVKVVVQGDDIKVEV